MNTHEVQKELSTVIFDNKAGGKDVTIVQGKGFQEIQSINFCPSCDQIHIVIKFTP